MPVLCAENTSAMFNPSRHPSPNSYNFPGTHGFSGYMTAQGGQYPTQTQDYNQFNVDPTAFQQAQCYMYPGSGSRPQGIEHDWINYGMTPSTSGSLSPQNVHAYSYRNTGHTSMGMDYGQHQVSQANQTLTVLGSPPQPVGSPTSSTSSTGSSGSPTNKQLRPPFDWMKKTSYTTQGPAAGKTRTKDKYRVVYSDHQRLELEKEFHYSRYITIRRKAELAQNLSLSERQVKIWFQNRRAKERKQNKKREESGKAVQDVNLHLDNTAHAQGLQLPLHSNSGLQPIIKTEEEFVHTPSAHRFQEQDQTQGHLHQTSPLQSVSSTQSSPVIVPAIKMDPHEIVSQA